jgi:hypothetical protein
MASVFLVSITTDISWLYYNVVGAVVVVLVGTVVSGESEGSGGVGIDESSLP